MKIILFTISTFLILNNSINICECELLKEIIHEKEFIKNMHLDGEKIIYFEENNFCKLNNLYINNKVVKIIPKDSVKKNVIKIISIKNNKIVFYNKYGNNCYKKR